MGVECSGVGPLVLLTAPDVRDNGAAEVDGAAVVVEDYFRDVGVGEGVPAQGGVETTDEGGDGRGGVGDEATADSLNLGGVDEWFVALDVDDDVGIGAESVECFAATVGTAAMEG